MRNRYLQFLFVIAWVAMISWLVPTCGGPPPQPSGFKDTTAQVPNPFSPPAFDYTLADSCHALITIYSVQGQLVDTVVNEFQPAGHHKFVWERATTMPGGVYFYRLKCGDLSATKKLFLVK